MSDLSSKHATARKLVIALREGLERLEGIENGSRPGNAASTARDLRVKLQELQRTSAEMDSIWRMQVLRESASKRDIWKRKVEQLAEETDSLRAGLDKFGTREQRRAAEQREREELFARAEDGRRAAQEMDEESQMAGSVHRSKRMLAEMFEQGTNVLATMAGTRERLKRTQRRMLDVLNTIGLGDALLRLIERRQRMDAYILYGGMAFLVLFALALVWWLQSPRGHHH